jgi:hypothetical protein
MKLKTQWLSESIDPHVLSIFRILFGISMAYEMIVYFRMNLMRNMFVLPAINFQYDFFRWVKPFPEMWLNLVLGAMLVCSLAVIAGVFFKWACRLFTIGYLYILLLDKSIFNNHIYLFLLLALLLSFTDADKCWSLRKKSSQLSQIPRWQVFILQLQIIIVYFYGGIAKLTYDWLFRCQPVRTLAGQITDDKWFGWLLKSEIGIYLFNYGGLIIDLGAPLLLWFKPLRKWAIYVYILFHILNASIFPDIGIFPYVMLLSLILFYDTNEVLFLKLLTPSSPVSKKLKKIPTALSEQVTNPNRKPVIVFLSVYFIFQLLFPLRGFLLPNDMDWTTIGNRFSWRMKVDTRQIEEMEFNVIDTDVHTISPVAIQYLVNDVQVMNLSMDPRSVADFAKLIKAKSEEKGTRFPQVMAKIKVRYNGRAPQYFVNPDKNLGIAEYSVFKRIDWVLPLKD